MMGQSRLMSAVETLVVSVSGFVVMLAAQICVFHLFGVNLPISENAAIIAIMVSIAMVHRYLFRRLFNSLEGWLHARKTSAAQA